MGRLRRVTCKVYVAFPQLSYHTFSRPTRITGTPHVLAPSKCHTSAPFGLDDQPPTKEPLAFDRVYDTRFDGKDTESHVVLGMLSSFNFLFSHFNHSLTNRFIRHGQTGRDASSEEENASSELTPGSETHAK